MAGILNKRNRFVDFILTSEGKRQASDGEMKARFASVSDRQIVYPQSINEVSQKKNDHFNLEACSFSMDNIVHEVDDSGRLTLPNESEEYSVVGNKIFLAVSGTTEDASGNDLKENITYSIIDKTSFASTAGKIKESSINNFKNNKFIQTKQIDPKFNNLELSINQHTFTISNSTPFPKGPLTEGIDIDDATPFMFDSKLAHYKNFKFLPPVNRDGTSIGTFQDLRSTTKETFQDIKKNLNIDSLDFDPLDQEGITYDYIGDDPVINRKENLDIYTRISKEFAKVVFKKGSLQNNIMLQIYEKDEALREIKKLDIVDAGEFYDEDDPVQPIKHVYYVGKVYFDNSNIPTFLNMFTLIFD